MSEYRLIMSDVELLPGCGDDLRAGAASMRSVVGPLRAAAGAADVLDDIFAGDFWSGAAWAAFVRIAQPVALHEVAAGAVEVMEEAAEALDRLAIAHDDHQERLRWCKRELASEVVAVIEGGADPTRGFRILDEVEAIHSAHEQAESDLREVLDRLDDAPLLATPPPGSIVSQVAGATDAVWDQAWEVGAGFTSSVVDIVKVAVVLSSPALLAHHLITNFQDYKAAFDFAVDNPGEFSVEFLKAMADVETLRENPARWLGGRIPDIALMLMTAGGGTAAKATSAVENGADAALAVTTTSRLVDTTTDARRGVRVVGRISDVGSVRESLSKVGEEASHDGDDGGS